MSSGGEAAAKSLVHTANVLDTADYCLTMARSVWLYVRVCERVCACVCERVYVAGPQQALERPQLHGGAGQQLRVLAAEAADTAH